DLHGQIDPAADLRLLDRRRRRPWPRRALLALGLCLGFLLRPLLVLELLLLRPLALLLLVDFLARLAHVDDRGLDLHVAIAARLVQLEDLLDVLIVERGTPEILPADVVVETALPGLL